MNPKTHSEMKAELQKALDEFCIRYPKVASWYADYRQEAQLAQFEATLGFGIGVTVEL